MQKPIDVEVAEAVLRRLTEPYGNEGYIRASQLLTYLRQVVWRNNIASESGAARLWNHFESRQMDMEWIIEMVNEYVYLIGPEVLTTQVAKRQSRAIGWVRDSLGIPEAMRKLSNSPTEALKALEDSPFLMFMFSLSMCDYNQRLHDVGVERMISSAGAKRG